MGSRRNYNHPPRPPASSQGGGGSYRPSSSRRQDRYDSYSRHDDRRDDRRGPFVPHSAPQGDFSFRVPQPKSIRDKLREADSYRPGEARPRRDGGRGPKHHRSSHHGGNSYSRGGQRLDHRHAANRLLLKTRHGDSGPEMSFADQNGVTYKSLEDLSDDEEAAMDISDEELDTDEDEKDGDEPPAKRARLSETDDGNAKPKWSNPDPYTALPPVDDAARPRRNFVHLIRKARVQPAGNGKASMAEGGDFISFDDDDNDNDNDMSNGGDQAEDAENQQDVITFGDGDEEDTLYEFVDSHKRTHDDKIKPIPRCLVVIPKGKMPPAVGHVLPSWRCKSDEDPTPWLQEDLTALPMHQWLLCEVRALYEYILPRDFERQVRQNLFDRLKNVAAGPRPFRDAQLFSFGSFQTGLYLPTGDMDMVLASSSAQNGGPGSLKKNALYHWRNMVTERGIAHPGTVQVIAHAKVPIIKFVDDKTGLRVDISIDNMNGVHAIKTFLEWKERYPVMPALTTIIKHFLAMRGLNEPANGGIGGFSVACLVVAMLQNRAQSQANSAADLEHLGELLIEFFRTWADFNYKSLAVRLDPPGIIPKSEATVDYRNYDRLSIIDPNDPDNDLAGGASNSWRIIECFDRAYLDLEERMLEMQEAQVGGEMHQVYGPHPSILSVLFEGNYQTWREQRRHLEQVYNIELKASDTRKNFRTQDAKRSRQQNQAASRQNGNLNANSSGPRAARNGGQGLPKLNKRGSQNSYNLRSNQNQSSKLPIGAGSTNILRQKQSNSESASRGMRIQGIASQS